jgi:hypothetical protein
MTFDVLSPREASIFACMTDTVVAPEPVLPAVRDTDTVAYLDRWLGRSPRLNRAGLRALIYAAELSPRLLGCGGRLRALTESERADALRRAEHSRHAPARQLAKLVKAICCLSYYGDDQVMRLLGYDADAVVARGRRLRAEEGRP